MFQKSGIAYYLFMNILRGAKSTDLAGQAGFTAKESDFSPVMKFVTI